MRYVRVLNCGEFFVFLLVLFLFFSIHPLSLSLFYHTLSPYNPLLCRSQTKRCGTCNGCTAGSLSSFSVSFLSISLFYRTLSPFNPLLCRSRTKRCGTCEGCTAGSCGTCQSCRINSQFSDKLKETLADIFEHI